MGATPGEGNVLAESLFGASSVDSPNDAGVQEFVACALDNLHPAEIIDTLCLVREEYQEDEDNIRKTVWYISRMERS